MLYFFIDNNFFISYNIAISFEFFYDIASFKLL